MNEASVHERQDTPDDPEYPGEGSTYDKMNPLNNVTIRDTRERKKTCFIKCNM